MKDNNIYDPEDLERLLASKSFHELLPEEKAFVLQYVENDLEYDSMRNSILSFNKIPELETVIQPKASSKETLMSAFEAAHGEEKENRFAAFWVWFWNTNKALFARPAFQLASLALVVSLGYYVTTFSVSEQMAENKTTNKESEKETSKEKPSVSEKKMNSDKETSKKDKVEDVKEKIEVEMAETPLVEFADEKDLLKDKELTVSNEGLEDGKARRDKLAYVENGDLDLALADEDFTEVEEVFIESEKSEEDLFDITETEVVLKDQSVDNLALQYDARTVIGNVSFEHLEAPEKAKTSSQVEINLTEKKNDLADKSTMAETASAFSGLISKLYTSN